MLSDLLQVLQTILDTIATALRWVYVVVLSLLFATLCGVLFLASRIGFIFLRLRGQHHVLCPENARPATIQIYALRGAMSGIVNDPKRVVRTCSQWPERSGCEQQCLQHIPRLRYK